MEIITKIEEELDVNFTGTTKRDAHLFISEWIEDLNDEPWDNFDWESHGDNYGDRI